ncbi:MAG: hypothetical protein ACOCRN_03650 [Spirochaetia bacterium]
MFIFWIPLAVMWLMMAIEQPALAAIVARLPDETTNLAAFGVAFSLALVIESPIIQLLTAATALAEDRVRYRKLLRFMNILGLALTLLHLVIAVTPLFNFVAGTILNVPSHIVEPARAAFLLMTPFAASVGYRRLWQGVLIRYGRTSVIPLTMLARLGASGAVLAWGLVTGLVPGASLAAIALIAGVVSSAAASWLFCRPVLRTRVPEIGEHSDVLDTRSLLAFYVPLSLTSVIFLSAQPLLTFGMARALYPVEALAVWPVINGFMFLFNALALSYQEAVVALLGQNAANEQRLRRFTWWLAGTIGVLFVLAGVTPFAQMWFRSVAGLPGVLLPYTVIPVFILPVAPMLAAAKSWFRGRLVHERKTGALAKAVVLHSVVLFACVYLGPILFDVPGAILAAVSLVIALAAEAGFLARFSKAVAQPTAVADPATAKDAPVPDEQAAAGEAAAGEAAAGEAAAGEAAAAEAHEIATDATTATVSTGNQRPTARR